MAITISIAGSITRSTISQNGSYYFDPEGKFCAGTPPKLLTSFMSVKEELAAEENRPVVFSSYIDSQTFKCEATFGEVADGDKAVEELTAIFKSYSVEDDMSALGEMDIDSVPDDSYISAAAPKNEEVSKLISELSGFLESVCTDPTRFKYSGTFTIEKKIGQDLVVQKQLKIQTYGAPKGTPNLSEDIPGFISCAREIVDEFSEPTATPTLKRTLSM